MMLSFFKLLSKFTRLLSWQGHDQEGFDEDRYDLGMGGKACPYKGHR